MWGQHRRVEFAGRKVLVTGAASGIGRATALRLAAEGAHLVLTDIASLDSVLAEVAASGGTVLAAECLDVSDHDAVAAFGQRVFATHGSLDVVMNIAGIAIWGSVAQLAHEDWMKLINVNLVGPINIIEAFVPPMIAAKRGGHLVNVSSAAGLFGLPWHAAYSASKFGVRGISEVLRFDLRRYKIGVTLVCPGAVDTGLVQTLRVAGVDRSNPKVKKVEKQFVKHAITPDAAAEKLIEGTRRRAYMVYTSHDIRIGHFFQRVFPWPYELAMRALNDRLYRASREALQP